MLTACQQQPEPQPAKAQLDSAQTQHDAVDLTLLCQKLEKNMMEINAQRTTFALEQINQEADSSGKCNSIKTSHNITGRIPSQCLSGAII